MAKVVLVTQVRSEIGEKPKRRGTLRALGLHGIGSDRLHSESDSLQGMLDRVSDLVAVELRHQNGPSVQRYVRTKTRSAARALEQLRSGRGATAAEIRTCEASIGDTYVSVVSNGHSDWLHGEPPMGHLEEAPQAYRFGQHWRRGIEFVKVEPGDGVVGIFWSTRLHSALGALGIIEKHWAKELASSPWTVHAESESGDEVDGHLADVQDKLASIDKGVDFLLLSDTDTSFQWLRERSSMQMGWLGPPHRLSAAIELLEDTGTDYSASRWRDVKTLIGSLSISDGSPNV